MTRGWESRPGFVTWFTVHGLENERQTLQVLKDPARPDPPPCSRRLEAVQRDICDPVTVSLFVLLLFFVFFFVVVVVVV